VSYTYCSDEREQLAQRQRVIGQLIRPLYPHITRERLMEAVEHAGLEAEVFSKGPNEVVVSDMGFVFDDTQRLREVTLE
jgi:hypothetical protein